MWDAGTRGLSSPIPSTYPSTLDPWQDNDESGQHREEDGDDNGLGGVEGEAHIGAGVKGEGTVPQCHPDTKDSWK